MVFLCLIIPIGFIVVALIEVGNNLHDAVNILNELVIFSIDIIKSTFKTIIINAIFEITDLFIFKKWVEMIIEDFLHLILNLEILFNKLRRFNNRKFMPQILLIF